MVYRTRLVIGCLFGVFVGVGLSMRVGDVAKAAEKTAAELEKEKALQNPYANDLGPTTIDISKYSAELQEGYRYLQKRCAQCHTPARPLNSQFLELKPEEIAEWKAKQPDVFQAPFVWQPESGVWQRYVKRMMGKPGCEVQQNEGKVIWKFLVYDSKTRKLGANKDKWAAHRKQLLAQCKEKYPKRYEELYGAKK
ncbi:MAG: hypothetical protein HYZ73_00090 [Elusimicrobia bacterium]|nr:hypothetical protein [Elusimicrobiota bacterium]